MNDDSSTMQQWTARDGQLMKNGFAMERWTAWQCRSGRLVMDNSAQWTGWQWTARQ